jgi:parallel beta-helix repeat protein
MAWGLTAVGAVGAATFSVTNVNDAGAGSLRQAVLDANAATGDDIITIGVTGSIVLTSGEIDITDGVTITGPGASALTVSGNDASRIFKINIATSTVSISGMTLTHGFTTDGGGALYIIGDGSIALTGVNITNSNSSNDGGGVYVDCDTCAVTISNATISGNTTSGNGGGIGTENGTSLLVTNSRIIGNTTTGGQGSDSGRGGGIFCDDLNFTLSSSEVSGNTGVNGGGVAFYSDQPNKIVNSTISGNTATGNAGGVYLYGGNNDATIENSTISGNTGTGIGVYYSDGHNLVLTSTIVANNTGADVARTDGGTPAFTANNSLIRTPVAGSSITGASNLIGVDPKLGPLANNGGPTDTMALLTGSPAINVGSNPETLAFDQRGNGYARTVGGGTDIGAFEFGAGPSPSVPVPASSPAGLGIMAALLSILGLGALRRRRSGHR